MSRTGLLRELREDLVDEALRLGYNEPTAQAYATEELTRVPIPTSYLRLLVKDIRWQRKQNENLRH